MMILMTDKTDKTEKTDKNPPDDPFRPPVRIGKPYVHKPKGASLNDDTAEAPAPDTEYEQGSDEMHKRLGL